MNFQTWLQVCINNPYQNIGQSSSTDLMNNLSLEPTVGDLNRNVSFGATTSESESKAPTRVPEDAFFGTHAHEAFTTLRKVFSR